MKRSNLVGGLLAMGLTISILSGCVNVQINSSFTAKDLCTSIIEVIQTEIITFEIINPFSDTIQNIEPVTPSTIMNRKNLPYPHGTIMFQDPIPFSENHTAPPVGCASCHIDPIQIYCTVCHPNPPLVFEGEYRYQLPHHYPGDETIPPNDCVNLCHDSNWRDIRYVSVPDPGHDFCGRPLCHNVGWGCSRCHI